MTIQEEHIGNPSRGKFIIGGLLILATVVFLIVSSTAAGVQYYSTVDELFSQGEAAIGRPSQVIGAVIGDTIVYDAEALTLEFTVAHMPADDEILEDDGGLAAALFDAVNDPTRARMEVIYYGVKPDLLQHEAQAILTGKLGDDGIFYADELLLKCPSKYEEVPQPVDQP
ncbi:MAG: cytochrome c maturation protein CcmE [Chloroflexota bacterium]